MKQAQGAEAPVGATETRARWPRRRMLQWLATAGVCSVFSRGLVALANGQTEVTAEQILQAEWISGVPFTEEERALMLDGVNELLQSYANLRAVPLDNGVAPALLFRPGADQGPTGGSGSVTPLDGAAGERPDSDAVLAFAPLTQLSALIRTRRISSVELTRIYLDRLQRFDGQLQCAISVTEELALAQAERADREIAAGHYRGPLHGVPWGAKDLLSVPGYRTTWGATPFEEQTLSQRASVAARLDEAGAVLVAKLTLGALAWGDVWYGGTTKNPWNLEQGSSGSSAGSASATAAGLVGFAIGTETWGSIVSPCTRCGTTGLRPTFGRVSRHGAMALAWSMDKIGPIARSVEDCALVFGAIQGPDGLDPSVVERSFDWPYRRDIRTLAADVEDEADRARAVEWQAHDRRSLEALRGMGLDLVPIELPDRYPLQDLAFILSAEASTAFDDLTRSGGDDLLVRQVADAWPNVLRQGQLIPAVEYIRANRIRSLVMQEMEEKLGDVDLYVCPSFGGSNLLLTNLTGHPCVVLPNGFRSSDGTPTSITFNGRLHREAELLAVARAYQQETGHHLRHPELKG